MKAKHADEINLGDLVRDTVTGLTGIVVAKTDWLHGCTRITVQPKELKDGKPVETSSFDEPQIELLEGGAVVSKLAAVMQLETGGPRPEPQTRREPKR